MCKERQKYTLREKEREMKRPRVCEEDRKRE